MSYSLAFIFLQTTNCYTRDIHLGFSCSEIFPAVQHIDLILTLLSINTSTGILELGMKLLSELFQSLQLLYDL